MSRVLARTTVLGILALAPVARGDILVSLSTDKPVYRPGEALDVRVTATNTASEPVVLQFVDGRQAHYVMDGVYAFPQGWTLALTQQPIAANSSHTWTFRHNWFAYNPGIGAHDVVGGVVGYGDAGPVGFEVVPPTPPTDDFRIDFDNAPGGGGTVQSISEYWPLGVHFRSDTANSQTRPGIHDGVLKINSTTYPPGFNIAADFDMGIHGASADVSAAVGVAITMIAKDKAGSILDTDVSDPVTALGSFVPVSVSSDQPIATIEWWPSNERSTVMVDNLAIAMPEPSAGLLVGIALLVLRRSRRR